MHISGNWMRRWSAQEEEIQPFSLRRFSRRKEGGQPCDLGTIGGLRVKNVTEKDGEVLHEMEVPDGADFFRPGQKVKMELDWERRFEQYAESSGRTYAVGSVQERI